ncbi:MAG: SDR family oxidoreductase [Oligoflexia bacterium]|nr:SDR family oxidoreductase [Oligoflexia bacterium]
MKVLITGGSSEIAQSIVERRKQLGDEVFITSSTASSLDSTLKKYKEELDLNVKGFVYDLENPTANLNEIESASFDILILNAASRNIKLRKFHEWSLSEGEKYLQTNINGNIRLLEAVLKGMIEKKFGRLLFISSLSASQGTSRFPYYCASKSAMEGLFFNLAVDYGPLNIFSNILRPGVIATERTKKFWKRSHYLDQVEKIVPARMLGYPDQIAEATDPLLSETTYMNGSVVTVSGGLPLLRSEGLLGV